MNDEKPPEPWPITGWACLTDVVPPGGTTVFARLLTHFASTKSEVWDGILAHERWAAEAEGIAPPTRRQIQARRRWRLGITRIVRAKVVVDEVGPISGSDSTPANVYADWLEEHGEPQAAAKLRAAPPLGPPDAG